MLNSSEHEIFSAKRYKNANYSLLADKFSCSVMLSKKEFAVVFNLRLISRTSGPGYHPHLELYAVACKRLQSRKRTMEVHVPLESYKRKGAFGHDESRKCINQIHTSI